MTPSSSKNHLAVATTRTQKRVRLSPPSQLTAESSSPPLPPLRSITAQPPAACSPVHNAAQSVQKLAELRRTYLEDIDMVVQELKNVLTFCPGSASPDSPVPPSMVLKLVRTVQTLERLRALLVMNPVRLRKVPLAQLNTVEQQVRTNLLPIATLLRSFDNQQPIAAQAQEGAAADTVKTEQLWCDAKSPRSPSSQAQEVSPRHDWRFLSMALSLQL